MADIPYMLVNTLDGCSVKGKFPWVLYEGNAVDDSSFIIEYLNRNAGVENRRGAVILHPEIRAIARAFQKLIEEELYWIVMIFRYGHKMRESYLQKLVLDTSLEDVGRIREQVMWNAWAQGLARHTKEDLIAIFEDDIECISNYLGKRPYLMGRACSEVDSSLFGLLAQIMWQMSGSPLEIKLKSEFPNLCKYCDRLKGEFFPDWDELHTHGGKRRPTKMTSQ